MDQALPVLVADCSDERLSRVQLSEAHARRRMLMNALGVLDLGGTMEDAAAVAGTSASTLSRVLSLAHRWLPAHAPHRDKARHLIGLPLADIAPGRASGRPDPWAAFVELPEVREKLCALYLATVRASSEAMSHSRRTGSVALALVRFSDEPECPPNLRAILRRGKQPTAFKRLLGKITTDVEQRFRGPKHFALHGRSQRRDDTIGLPDGMRVMNRAGFVIEFDDMSVNQPFWSEGPDGALMLSRQGLYARDVRSGRWLGFELIARPREAYRSEDILRFVRRLMQQYGKFPVLRMEHGAWHARSIDGVDITPHGECQDVKITRPGMAEEERNNLQAGLRDIGIEIHYVHTAHQKGGLEGGFAELQRIIATYTIGAVNIGAHAGEFEAASRQLRRARAGSHPRDLGIAHIDQLGVCIERAVMFANDRVRRDKKTADEIWASDQGVMRLDALSPRDLAAFLPHCTEVSIRDLKVTSTVRGVVYDFRAAEFATLGNGFAVVIRFDPTEPGLGAAVYNREGNNLSNHGGWALGQFLCWARHEIPAPEYHVKHAETAALLGPGRSLDELYYPGAVDAGGEIRKLQGRDISGAVRTFASIMGRPGERPVRSVTARTGTGQSLEAATVRVDVSPPPPPPASREPEADQPVELPYHIRRLLADGDAVDA